MSILQLKRHVVTIDGYTDVQTNNEKQLLQAVATQPVSVGICGSARAFQLYSKVGPNIQNLETLEFLTKFMMRFQFYLCDRGYSLAHVQLLWIMLYWL